MEKYISKSAVVAEIEKLNPPFYPTLAEKSSYRDAVKDCIDIIDTLEVKEVDLEKEVANWWNDHYKNLKDDYKFEKYNGHYMDNSTIISLAEHFYELGIKAQKGE